MKIVEATEAFTGADVKRLVEDAKGLYAFDQVGKAATRPATDYFIEAANGVREHKQRYQTAEEAARCRPKSHSRFAGLFYPRTPPEED